MEEEIDIEDIDKENMGKMIEDFPAQIREGFKTEIKAKPFENIFIVGMGGSALAGSLLKSYLYNINIPIHVVRSYFMPEFVNKKSLVFVVSHSGNTEETINAYRTAIRKDANIIAMSSGGKLEKLALRQGITHVRIPFKNVEPRMTYCFQFFAMLKILNNSGFIEVKKSEVEKTIENFKKPMFKKMAEELAEKLIDKIPLIYSSDKLSSVAYKWKIDFNENAKIHAFCNYFSEIDHNEIVGYRNLKADYYVILIKDEDDYHKIKKRMDITKKLIKKNHVDVTELALKGHSLLIRMFTALYVGDWTSYYLAIKYKTDPSPVKMVEDFKKHM